MLKVKVSFKSSGLFAGFEASIVSHGQALPESLVATLLSFLASSAAFPADGFHEINRSKVPPEALAQICNDFEGHPCWKEFLKNGKAFAIDANDDGRNEFLIHIGFQDTGSGGDGYALVQKQGSHWKEIDDGYCLIYWGLRLKKLDKVRFGYHDLRLGRTQFVKWAGTKYVSYEPADYRALSPSLFDPNDPGDSEILWLIHNAGVGHIAFEPHWISQPRDLRYAWIGPVRDASQQIDWLGVGKGGVWGIRNKRAFLLLPRASYLGATDIQLDGDWLVIYGDPWCAHCASHSELARYQLRSHELVIASTSQIPFSEN